VIELSEKELEKWVARAMTDTGFVGRELLGYNYDLDHKTGKKINVGTGGLRDEPPYTTMTEFVADPDKQLCMLLAPRGGLKSSTVKADCVRNFLAHPDDATLFMSGTTAQVRKWSISIRDTFEFNPNIEAWFGQPLKGYPWTVDEWTLSTRNDASRADPSFRIGSLKRLPTGGHYNRIYLDDIIDWRNCRTQAQLDLAKMLIHLVMPLRVPGAKIIVTGTRYNPGDVYSYIDSLPGWNKLVMGTGFEIAEGSDGLFKLTGEKPMFPHLTKAYLEQQLGGMDFEEFCSQYLNRHVSGLSQTFKREWFQPIPWEPEMANLTTWIVTDSALSKAQGACYSVALVVGLDAARRMYLLDAFVGKVEPGQYVDELFSLHHKWSALTMMTGWTIERVTMAMMLQGWIETEARRRGVRLNIREIPRGGGERSKDDRIRRLQPKMRAKDLYVVDTFPRTYRDGQRLKSLWDPTGFLDTNTQQRLPGGELVEQFAQFPYYAMKDIADALADVEHYFHDKSPACYVRRPQTQMGGMRIPKFRHDQITEPWIDSRVTARQDWIRALGRPPG